MSLFTRKKHLRRSVNVYPIELLATYIINRCNELDIRINNLRLQKLLYLVQREFIVFSRKHQHCFNNRVEMWELGPTYACVYYTYSKYDNQPIPTQTLVRTLTGCNEYYYCSSMIDPIDQLIIDYVLQTYGNLSTCSLIALTKDCARIQSKRKYSRGTSVQYLVANN